MLLYSVELLLTSYFCYVNQNTDCLVMTKTTTLWRPVGIHELALLEDNNFSSWPPRLKDQPIFYPVLNREYATKIAKEWNAKIEGSGFVTQFEVETDYLNNFEVQQVGGQTILEYWIPAEDLGEFNTHLVGQIVLIESFELNKDTDKVVAIYTKSN